VLSDDFLAEFKPATEEKWSERPIDRTVCGSQFQRGARWDPGLPDERIAEYEGALGVRFPHDFVAFLRAVNGTDLPTLSVYGDSGYPPRQSVGVYSYPRDIEVVRQGIEDVQEWRAELERTMAEQGFVLAAQAARVPIYIHRYVVCAPNLDTSVVLSIADEADDRLRKLTARVLGKRVSQGRTSSNRGLIRCGFGARLASPEMVVPVPPRHLHADPEQSR
jgi:hypothetical protein